MTPLSFRRRGWLSARRSLCLVGMQRKKFHKILGLGARYDDVG
jgi:hypothetical protein